MKRFLSIFAILAMVVSMFSGVAFAEATANATYTLGTTNVVETQVYSDVEISITPSVAAGAVAADINGYKVAVLNSSDAKQFEVTIADGKITLPKADVAGLADGTYKVKLDAPQDKVGVEGANQYIDVDESSDYNASNDALVVAGSLVVAAAPVVANNTYTIGDEDFVRKEAGASVSVVVPANLNGYQVGVYNSDGSLMKKSDNSTDFMLTAASNAVAFTQADLNNLPAGIYTLKLNPNTTGLKASGDFQYFDLNGDNAFVEANDAKVVAGTLTVKKVYEIILDETKVTYNNSNAIASIPGKIIDADSKAIVKVSGNLKIEDAAGNPTSYSISYTDGQFNFKVYPSALKIGEFKIVGTPGDFTDAVYKEEATFTVMYSMELAEPSTFEFKYPIGGQIVLQGVFNNEDAKRVYATTGPDVAAYTANLPAEDLWLGYIGSDGMIDFHDYSDGSGDTPIAKGSFSNNKNFGFLFDGARIYKSGKIGIFLKTKTTANKADFLLIKSGKVTVDTFETTVTKELPEKLGNQDLVVTTKLPSKYFDKTNTLNLVSGYKVSYKIYKKGDADKVAVGPTGNITSFDKKGQIKAIELDLQKASTVYPRGEYTIELLLKNSADVIQLTSTANFSVVKANNFNLLKWEEETKRRVGDFTFAFDGTSSDVHQNIFVKNSDGDEEVYTEVIFNGCGLDNKKVISKDIDATKGKDKFTVSTKETGVLEVTINVYENKTDDKPAATFKREVKIVGWNVTISSTKVTVGSEEDIVFEIVDEEGNSVNNAYIRLASNTSKILVDGRKTNINGGVYTYKEDGLGLFDNVETLGLEFCVDDSDGNPDVMVKKASGITVVGKEVYTVTPSASVLLNGIAQKFTVEVLDENGDVVYPTFKRYDIDADGNEIANTSITVGSRKDVDGDGVNESVEITVTCNADQPEMIIRATTDAGKKMGEARIEVQKPVVTMTGAKTITNGFNNKFEFQLIDPRDNSVMSNDVKIEVPAALATYVPTFDQKAGETLDSNKEVWTGTYYAKEVKFADAAKAEKDLVAYIIMEGDNSVEVKVLAIPIVAGTLTATPDHVIIGQPTNITLTYTDGDGNPLANRKVLLGDTEEAGTTNEDGKIVYSSSATSSLALVFNAKTDYADIVTKKISSKADTEAPKVEVLSIAKDGKSATLKITDNVRLHVSYVNGELVEMKFPKADAIHVVTGLVPGINKVEFLAADTNFNYTEETIEIEVVAPVIETVEFTLNNPVGDLGTPVKVGTTSMIPARLVEELGVSFGWNAETQTVEYSYGETTVQLTVGSKTAIVNGENKELPEAPYLNAQGRLMVPVRMVGQNLGFDVKWTSDDAPIIISK